MPCPATAPCKVRYLRRTNRNLTTVRGGVRRCKGGAGHEAGAVAKRYGSLAWVRCESWHRCGRKTIRVIDTEDSAGHGTDAVARRRGADRSSLLSLPPGITTGSSRRVAETDARRTDGFAWGSGEVRRALRGNRITVFLHKLSRHKMQGCTMAALRGKFVSTIYACVVVSVASVMVATPFVTVTVYVLRLSPVTV